MIQDCIFVSDNLSEACYERDFCLTETTSFCVVLGERWGELWDLFATFDQLYVVEIVFWGDPSAWLRMIIPPLFMVLATELLVLMREKSMELYGQTCSSFQELCLQKPLLKKLFQVIFLFPVLGLFGFNFMKCFWENCFFFFLRSAFLVVFL